VSLISQALKKAQGSKYSGPPQIPTAALAKKKSHRSKWWAGGLLLTIAVMIPITLPFASHFFSSYFQENSLPAPEYQSVFSIQKKQTAHLPTDELVISGIVSEPEANYALINGTIVEEGDTIRQMKVVKIHKDRVVLRGDDGEHIIRKEF